MLPCQRTNNDIEGDHIYGIWKGKIKEIGVQMLHEKSVADIIYIFALNIWLLYIIIATNATPHAKTRLHNKEQPQHPRTTPYQLEQTSC